VQGDGYPLAAAIEIECKAFIHALPLMVFRDSTMRDISPQSTGKTIKRRRLKEYVS
jgi:hypothetical protein